MKKIYALAAAAILLCASAATIVIVKNNDSDSLFDANVEALAQDEVGVNCHYTNGYTEFGDRDGGAYDCCAKWRDKRPASTVMCK